jgi:EAL domain-containing protein (putative c-di-GMP-specific phosphodiesterase class I)
VSLDDFGTGYSALSYLKKFELDYVKVDRSFVRDIVNDPKDRAIVDAIIAMAKRLGICPIAEGVETVEQANLLHAAGCELAQGFLFARPMPAEEFLRFAHQRIAGAQGQELVGARTTITHDEGAGLMTEVVPDASVTHP